MSVNGSPDRRDRRNACSMRSSSSARFGSPVSGSRRASECAVSSRVEEDADRGGDERTHDECGDDVVGRLAEQGRRRSSRRARAWPGTKPTRTCFVSCRRLVDRHLPPFCPALRGAAVTSDSSAGNADGYPQIEGRSSPRVRQRRHRTVRHRQEAVLHRGIEMRGRRCRSRRSRSPGIVVGPLADRLATNAPLHDPLLRSRAAIVPYLDGHRGNGAPGSGEWSRLRIHARGARRTDLLLGTRRDHAHRLRAPADSGQDRPARRGRRSRAPNDRRSERSSGSWRRSEPGSCSS